MDFWRCKTSLFRQFLFTRSLFVADCDNFALGAIAKKISALQRIEHSRVETMNNKIEVAVVI